MGFTDWFFRISFIWQNTVWEVIEFGCWKWHMPLYERKWIPLSPGTRYEVDQKRYLFDRWKNYQDNETCCCHLSGLVFHFIGSFLPWTDAAGQRFNRSITGTHIHRGFYFFSLVYHTVFLCPYWKTYQGKYFHKTGLAFNYLLFFYKRLWICHTYRS